MPQVWPWRERKRKYGGQRKWNDIFKALKRRIINQEFYMQQSYASEMKEKKNKTFLVKQKLRDFVTSRPDLQEIIKGLLLKQKGSN